MRLRADFNAGPSREWPLFFLLLFTMLRVNSLWFYFVVVVVVVVVVIIF